MINIDDYMENLTAALKTTFAERLVYIGLQGGYRRGEADDNSDIDIMLVLDALKPEDMDSYSEILRSLGHFDKACGFICGKEELEFWNRLEVCQLIHETKDYYGCLKSLMPEYNKADVANYIRFSVGNLYHELCHRYVYTDKENSAAKLAGCYKVTFYMLQNLYWLKTGEYILSKAELLSRLDGLNRAVLSTGIELKQGGSLEFDKAYLLLFNWCRETIIAAQA